MAQVMRFRPGGESVYAGKGTFYSLPYGPHLVGMNMTSNQTFELKWPKNEKQGRDLVSRNRSSVVDTVTVGLHSTTAIWV